MTDHNESTLPSNHSDDPLTGDDILSQLISVVRKLDPAARKRLLQALAIYFDIGISDQITRGYSSLSEARSSFSEDRTISAKEFIMQKLPQTDIERVACLAYYLTHYRSVQEFKTFDLSKLNTEAAQIKFSNPAQTVNNTKTMGLLVSTTKGNKQISALGELYVQALPDREAAKAVLAGARPRRKSRRARTREIHKSPQE